MVITLGQISVQFSHSVVSDSLRLHGLQHPRPPCPSPTPGAYSNSCPLSPWCHPSISSFVIPFSCLQFFVASGSFPMSQLFTHIRWPKYWSFSFSFSPPNEYSGLISFRMHWLNLLALQGTLKSLLQHHSSKASILWLSALFIVQLSHSYMTTGKPWPWLDRPLLEKWCQNNGNYLCFSNCSRLTWAPLVAQWWRIHLQSVWPELGRSPGGGHGNPLQYSCLENPHRQRSLAGYSLWGRKELDMTERLSNQHSRLNNVL